MPVQNHDFEIFLQGEANKLFKALPTDPETSSLDFSRIVQPEIPLDITPTESDIASSALILVDPFREDSIIPKAIAGSGKTPAHSTDQRPELETTPKPPTVHVEDDFDISKPQTSFRDTAFYDGEIPKSVAGSGKQPGLVSHVPSSNSFGGGSLPNQLAPPSEKPLLPFQETYDDYTGDLAPLLNQINHLKHLPQLPFDQSINPYYFVGEDRTLSSQLIPGTGSVPFSETFDQRTFDVYAIRQDFPILGEYVNGRQLVWLDNAATTQKPQSVIDRIAYFYQHENSNIHRAAHALAARATDAYEEARNIIQKFINAQSSNEIIFTRGTTESINLVAQSWGDQHLQEGDEIIISHLEHHANIVPWQQLSKKKGFKIRVIPVDDEGNLLLDEYVKLLNSRTKLVSFTHVSNALGTITPAKTIINLAHQAGAKVLLDGAQSISHIAIDVQELNPDFFVFSGHKIFGPTGIGVVYGREELLNSLQPYQSGGNMIRDVTLEKSVFQDAPNRFEAGTGNIADAVGLGAAIEYVERIGINNIYHYEHTLLEYATTLLRQIPGISLIGTAKEKTSVLSFTLKGYNNDEVGQALNNKGIAVRTGHHCAQPILRRLGYETSVRPSLAFYNTYQEIDLLANTVEALARHGRRY